MGLFFLSASIFGFFLQLVIELGAATMIVYPAKIFLILSSSLLYCALNGKYLGGDDASVRNTASRTRKNENCSEATYPRWGE